MGASTLPTYRVDVQPKVLVWARTSIGMSIETAAAKIGIDALTLRFWEEGAYEFTQPTLVQLRKMAEVYKRPIGAFYLEDPPLVEKETLPDFRLLKRDQNRAWSPELHAIYRRV